MSNRRFAVALSAAALVPILISAMFVYGWTA